MVTSRILGPDGQPIRLADIAEPQTSQLGFLHQEFQTHPARGLTPSKLNSILIGAEQGDVIAQYELFEDMEERDGHILSEMTKRRRVVSGLTWDVVPPEDATAAEKEEAARLRQLLNAIEDLDGILFDTTDAIGKGFSCQEIEWQRTDGSWLPKSIEHRPQSWFRLHRGYRQEIRLRDNSPEGAVLRPLNWITHTHKARSGYVERANIFRALVWPYLFKNYSVGDLAEFLEIYGIPLRIGKYQPGASDKEKTTLLRALMQVGRNAAGIIPDGMSLDFHDAADGDPAAFQLMIDWCERTVSKVILGATLTSQADRGSNTNALGNVHNEVRKDLRDADAKQVAATLSRDLVYPIAVLNGMARNGYGRCPRLVLDTAETQDVKSFAESLPVLAKAGMRIGVEWAHKELGIPMAEEGAPVLQVTEAAVAPPPAPTEVAAATARIAAAAAQVRPRDREDQLVALLADTANPVVLEWVDQVQALVDGAGSLEELREGLLQLLPELDAGRFAQVMQHALAIAGAAGMLDALDESRA
ncbi:hypothetical protein CSC62_14050 [Pseudoxanthomonas jiangsuensis]|uniref:DUF935 domain-containing protein n=1 Tax=Pseudoxanthomonas jiangsuensis TaxID=619688 RepID=UPI001391437B|nr:DUF935 domain-containing protein [Pseudoxanthomonas jiangsuensis]KAF1692752.1 hypothetical protein CSC62_14050 [Pseudoxanthomonas jiangsuensis]